MADVYTVTFIILGILLTFPALLVALNLLLPRVTQRAAERVTQAPFKLFGLGLVVALVLGFLAVGLGSAGAGPLRFVGFALGLLGLSLGAIGSAGIARLLGDYLARWSTPTSKLTNLVRGAVIYELAGLLPLLGWFVFVPIMGLVAVGAATLALLRPVPQPATDSAVNITVGASGLETGD